jgi:hypothetical protein
MVGYGVCVCLLGSCGRFATPVSASSEREKPPAKVVKRATNPDYNNKATQGDSECTKVMRRVDDGSRQRCGTVDAEVAGLGDGTAQA